MEDKTIFNERIGNMTNLGAGVIREDDGRVVFVRRAVTGDVCDVRITKTGKSFSSGEITKLHTPSPHRIPVDCSAFENGCGGCIFRHIYYEHELSVKEEYVRSLFAKAKLDATVEPIRTAGEYEVRTKVTVPFSCGGSYGYYSENTHSIIENRACRLHDEKTNSILKAVSELAKLHSPSGLHHVTVRNASLGTMVIITSSEPSDEKFARTVSEELTKNFDDIKSFYFHLCGKDSVRGKYIHILGDTRIADELTNCRFLISPDAFYQVNHGGAEILYTLAKNFADLKDGDSVADLYCGTGTIGLSVIKNSSVNAELFGIEIVESAVSDAIINAENNGIKAKFISADAAVYDSNANVVIVDPPRAGCSEKLLTHLTNTLPDRIVYISCDPATLVRDCKILSDKYKIERVVPVDMFPRTSHCECAVKLTLK